MLKSLLNTSQNTHKQTSRTSSVFILPAHSGDDLHIPIKQHEWIHNIPVSLLWNIEFFI